MSGMFDDRYEEAAREVSVPQPLGIQAVVTDATEFPIAALSATLGKAILAISEMAQVPVSLAAQSVLAAAALAAQPYINVETITGQSRPVSLFFFTIAASGDRKSTSDQFAIDPVKRREELLAVDYQRASLSYSIAEAAYKAATQKAKAGANKTRDDIRKCLEDCGTPPQPPVQPLLTADEPTGPGLQRLFAEAMPALGLFSDEGATFLGGWSMQEENQAATGGMLSKLWDGSPIKRIRADKENATTILYGRRLSLHLMVQPDIANSLLGNKAVRNQGLLSRILVAAPKSLKGSRFWKEPSDDARANLDRYQKKLALHLERPFAYREETSRALDLDLIVLQPEARTKLIAFSDHCEKLLGPGGKYEQIADFASKMTENATRLAAVIAWFESSSTLLREGLSERAVNAGIALVEFYAEEAARLYGTPALDDDDANAATLIEWVRKREFTAIGLRFLNRRGPTQVRSASVLKRAIQILVEHGHLVAIKGGATLELEGGPKFYAEAFTVVPVDVA
ncbi:YfjI family protein [Sphingomonas immobilis]|uniref:YfjI family protein n=1 Tax=Sphingomonas immobilis TaxID=3063997 RepID=A0ABT9A1L0_9SPHN|nr:YfjI family protein [Sphingomonas sp. CA1-15]MDO7843438.1 YfjI family protein [Sphingomonas sp. CA1-15]